MLMRYYLKHIACASMTLLCGLVLMCSLKKFRSCYNRCAKLFFGYKRQDSLTEMLLLCRIPSFETIVHNSKFALKKCLDNCVNALVNCYSLYSYL